MDTWLGDWEPVIDAATQAWVDNGHVAATHVFVDLKGRFVPTHSLMWHENAQRALDAAAEWYWDRTWANARMVERAG
jgi:hypothetical protein